MMVRRAGGSELKIARAIGALRPCGAAACCLNANVTLARLHALCIRAGPCVAPQDQSNAAMSAKEWDPHAEGAAANVSRVLLHVSQKGFQARRVPGV